MNGDAEKVLEWFLGDNSSTDVQINDESSFVYGKRARKTSTESPPPVPDTESIPSDAKTLVHIKFCYNNNFSGNR